MHIQRENLAIRKCRECDPDIRSLYIFYWRTVSCWSLTGISNFGQILLLLGTNFALSQTFKKKHNGACYVPSGLFLEEGLEQEPHGKSSLLLGQLIQNGMLLLNLLVPTYKDDLTCGFLNLRYSYTRGLRHSASEEI